MPKKRPPFRNTPLHFRLASGVDCLVHEEAIHALGLKAANELDDEHRRFLQAIAAEKVEWMRHVPSTILICEKDVAAHLYG